MDDPRETALRNPWRRDGLSGPQVISHLPARGAADVLQDINQGFRPNLAEYPGVDPYEDEGDQTATSAAELYARHGWPDQFDGDAFEVGLLRRRAAEQVKEEGDPLQQSLEEAQIIDRALEAARADVERVFPGKDVAELAAAPSAPGQPCDEDSGSRAWAKMEIPRLGANIKTYNEWKETVPENLRDVRVVVDLAISLAEGDLEEYRARV
ncbi:hypothetical protein PG999_014252 [Apiospora kogelbergensis]|uniref:Uncharacterized protein n=1 Tax=Apiospora kogelbergensis TaxID=1337665 RepID=A0AAW0QGN7_9PEZI